MRLLSSRGRLGHLVRATALVSSLGFLAACAQPQEPFAGPSGPTPVLINPDYVAGAIEIPAGPIPTLQDVINRAPSRDAAPRDGEDRLRSPAMREAAMAYGAKAGLAWENRNIMTMLNGKADQVSRVYDFDSLLIRGPDNVKILPPVISEARETWESSEAGRTLRVADTSYEIIEQARFTPVAPLWHTYLVRDYQTPEPPPDVLLPRDSGERDQWSRWVSEGWAMGREQAQEIFKSDLERLERDFAGMVRYKALLEEGKVSAPVVADARLGTTGTGDSMRVNDRAIRITQDPQLQVRSDPEWQASPTTPGPDALPTGSDPTVAPPPASARPAARSAPAPRTGTRRAW